MKKNHLLAFVLLLSVNAMQSQVCMPDCNNHVMNGHFEYNNGLDCFNSSNSITPSPDICWENCIGTTFDYFGNTIICGDQWFDYDESIYPDLLDFVDINSEHCGRIIHKTIYSCCPEADWDESMAGTITGTMTPGNNYNFSMNALMGFGNQDPAPLAPGPGYVTVLLVNTQYCSLNFGSNFVLDATNPGIQILLNKELVPDDHSWHLLNHNFTLDNYGPYDKIVVAFDSDVVAFGIYQSMYVDNILITDVTPTTPTLNIPDTAMSYGGIIQNLGQYASPAGGVYEVNGLTLQGGVWNWNSPTIIPENDGSYLDSYIISYTVADAFGCKHVVYDEIPFCYGSQPVLSATIVNTCTSNCDASASVTAVGGTGAVEIIYPDADFTGLSIDFNALCPGSYVITAQDAKGCNAIPLVVEIFENTFDQSITTVTNASCPSNADGTVDLTVVGGVAPFTYAWTGTGGYTSSAEDPQNLSPGTYSVVVTDANGCTAANGPISIASSSIFYASLTINNQADVDAYLNSQTVFIQNALTFNANTVEYELHDAVLTFGLNGTLKVNEGAKLEAIDCIFTSCGPSWVGIQVASNSLTSATPGNFKAQNCLVSNAQVGARTTDAANPAQTNITLAQAGGIQFYNSQFINNTAHAIITKSWNQPYCEFNNCDFEWNDAVAQRFPTFYTVGFNTDPAMMKLKQCKFVRVQECSFQNLTTQNNWERRYKAIRAESALLWTQSGNTTLISYINGFRYGIHQTLLSSEVPLYSGGPIPNQIIGFNFDHNRLGYYASNFAPIGTIIRKNVFNIGFPTNITDLDNQASAFRYEGIHMLDAQTPIITENNFIGNPTFAPPSGNNDNSATIGITMNSNNTGDVEVYKNYFTNLNFGNLSNGTNRQSNLVGLRYVCNENYDNDVDFGVANGSVIRRVQVDLTPDPNTNYATGNLLSTDLPGTTYVQHVWNTGTDGANNNTNTNISYRAFTNEANQTPTDITQTTVVFQGENDCAAILFDGGGENMMANIGAKAQAASNARVAWQEAKYLYDALLDDGTTEQTKEEIDNAWSGDAWELRGEMLAVSPYLSQEVAYTMLDKTTVFPHAMQLEILLANPDLAKDEKLLVYLNEKDNPMPEYMIELMRAAGNQSTYRTILENAMQNSESLHQQAYNEMIRAKSESEDYTLAQHLADLDMIDSPYMEYTLADYEAANGQLQDALYRLEDLVLNRDMGKEELIAHDEMISWLNLRSEVTDWSAIDASQLSTLETLAYSSTQSLASGNAQSILNEYFEGEFYSEANTSFTEMGTRSAQLQTEVMKPAIQVYPVPADEFINVQLQLAKWNETTALQVFNTNGQLITELKIINAKQQLILPTIDLASGVYHIKIIQDGKQLEEHAFTVAR